MCVCNKMGRFPPGDKETPSSQSQANGKRHPGLNPGVFTRWPCPNRDPRIHPRRAPGGAGSVPGSPRAATVACVVARPPVRTPTHAHRYTDISRDTWFVTMWRAGQQFWGVKFLFFLSLYSVNGMSVIKNKQIENRLKKKNTLHTPFLSSALKYRINTHILPVFSYSESILTCHLILASYFSHVYLPVTCICYLKQEKK